MRAGGAAVSCLGVLVAQKLGWQLFLVTPILSQKFGREVPTERDEEKKGKEEEEKEEEGTSTVEPSKITAAKHNPNC